MVSVTIVTWNSEAYLRECFTRLRAQDYRELEVLIVDNASSDGTRTLLREVEPRWKVIYNDSNVGFAAGQNQAIRAAAGEWVLCLNADVILSPDFVSQLVAAGEAHRDAGSLCGKLLRWNPATDQPGKNIIDSTGIYFTRNMRHLDRGAEQEDCGQYDRMQYVFGASGAAAMFRLDFIAAVSVEGQFFDEEFFAFREDGDLAWRAQLMGWRCLYTPAAVAWHVRRVTPERRADLPLVINWHSVKNRFLMRGKNASGWLCWRLFFPVAWRDLMTLGYALLRDWRMISAVFYPLHAFDNIRHKRAIIQARRKVSDHDLVWWFCDRPRAVDTQSAGQQSAVSSQPSAGRE
jgi:GT2 family glycosyltransferase